jgi:tRNA-dihydrouridine synthase A
VHARKAWLSGLSPKENREIPPLRYEVVHRLKRDFPHLTIAINGGITSLDAAEAQLAHLDGVMIGREAYQNPWMLAEADRRIFGEDGPVHSRRDVVDGFLPYVEANRSKGVPLGSMTRHILGLYQAVPGARAFRRHLAENAHRPGAGPEVLRAAVDLVETAIEQRRAA